MSGKTQNNDNQEIDLSQVSKKIGDFFDNIATSIFEIILFFKRNIIWIGLLLIAGIALGLYLDKTSKIYDNQVIVAPNFGSNDYLYSKVELLNSKIEDNDLAFLSTIGLKKPESLAKVEIEPIIDIYKFIDNNTENFELVKLMAEDGEISKIVKDNMTSKNYPFHSLKLISKDEMQPNEMIQPVLNYLNDSDYFKRVQKEYLNNLKIKMVENDSIISQINGVLGNVINTTGAAKSNSLVYYNDNMQLNDIIKTKDALISEQGIHRLEFINYDRVIKDISIVANVTNTSGANGKMKFALPFIFLGLFIVLNVVRSFYRKQLAKSKE